MLCSPPKHGMRHVTVYLDPLFWVLFQSDNIGCDICSIWTVCPKDTVDLLCFLAWAFSHLLFFTTSFGVVMLCVRDRGQVRPEPHGNGITEEFGKSARDDKFG